MGQGYTYVCKKCGKKYDVYTGVGMLFPQVYKNTLKDIAEGRQGKARQELFKRIPYLAVDAEDYYYECEDCGYWSVEQGLDLYEPKNIEKIKKQQFGEKSAEELGYVPYVTSYDLKSDYVPVERYEHKCPKCHGLMKIRNRSVISCPNCGAKNRPTGNAEWD